MPTFTCEKIVFWHIDDGMQLCKTLVRSIVSVSRHCVLFPASIHTHPIHSPPSSLLLGLSPQCSFLSIAYSMFHISCLFAYCLLPFAYFLLPIAYCLSLTVYCLLPVPCCLLHIASPLLACCTCLSFGGFVYFFMTPLKSPFGTRI